jgi:hypothetical protein
VEEQGLLVVQHEVVELQVDLGDEDGDPVDVGGDLGAAP